MLRYGKKANRRRCRYGTTVSKMPLPIDAVSQKSRTLLYSSTRYPAHTTYLYPCLRELLTLYFSRATLSLRSPRRLGSLRGERPWFCDISCLNYAPALASPAPAIPFVVFLLPVGRPRAKFRLLAFFRQFASPLPCSSVFPPGLPKSSKHRLTPTNATSSHTSGTGFTSASDNLCKFKEV